MYSDDEFDDEKLYHFYESPPYLLLFGEDLAESMLHESTVRIKIKEGKEDATKFAQHQYSLFYRVLRFFKSVEGYHSGYLDLTGRHKPRYLALQARWSAYIADFLQLTIHVEEYPSEYVTWKGVQMPCIEYRFKDPKVWEAFERKWKVPSAMWSYEGLLNNTAEVLRVISNHPQPQFQKLCLVDLPPEILDMIFQQASTAQARLLSSTCQWLNEVGRHYIFSSRALTFAFPFERYREMAKADDRSAYLEQLARSSRDQVLSSTSFLLSRPDLMQKMRTLCITDQWSLDVVGGYLPGGFDVSSLEDGFHTAMYNSFTKVLGASTNLTSIKFNSMTLTLDFFRCISQVPCLHTLDFARCHIRSHVRQALESADENALSCSAYNLHLSHTEQTSDLWHVMLACPRLRTLSADCLGGVMGLPVPDILYLCTFFSTLEHFYLSSLSTDRDTLDILVIWLSAGPALKNLTHFKFATSLGVPDWRILVILTSLQAPSLRVLALEGLAEAEFSLFEGISECFPELVGLTLIRRASNRQSRTKQLIWPHPAWEYARYMGGFPHLQHFGWNYDDCYNYFSCESILRLEEGFYPEMNYAEILTSEQNEYLGADEYTPRVFAAACPSLDTYASMEFTINWCISRAPNGKISAQVPKGGRYRLSSQTWDPSGFTRRSWPDVLPEGCEQSRSEIGWN
ncbi:hypothetical protein Hypma_013410 [Hypsizygus marmoreus]|uniref:F-box domain-containing protein n=1 Tax=Hypsizygus marmoreus TaxID=39966 RepID=A0A369JCB6_HYPMA|nr:hypothetical protein Hypma_013410 [Hypsizygus marmoreus]